MDSKELISTDGSYGLLVSHRGQFEGGRGGTQICSLEYHDTIAAAGISLDRVLLDLDQRLSTRLLKRIVPTYYFRTTKTSQVHEMLARAEQFKPDFVFLNQTNLAHLAAPLRKVLPSKSKIILLSHGLESTDLLHYLRVRRLLPIGGRRRPTPSVALGLAIRTEASLRKDIDQVFVLSQSDAVLEQWVGARDVVVVPRTVTAKVLDWNPVGYRLGFVGTLDHAPNLEGLVLALQALHADLSTHSLERVRVVGGPGRIGKWLARTFPMVEYLGQLTDQALMQEAASWNAFLHPIFCCARGASTKLADPIGWGIPVITTSYGRRGYVWSRGDLTVAEYPRDFASACHKLMDIDRAREARASILEVLASSPTRSDIATLIACTLGTARPLVRATSP